MVLVGVESKYVRDRHTSPKTEAEKEKLTNLSKLEEFRPASASDAEKFKKDAKAFKAAAKAKFEERAGRITKLEIDTIKQSASGAGADTSHIRFQFDTPVRKGESLVYEVRFRELKFDGSERERSKLGIIKGGREERDETPADTVVREVGEEVGMKLSKTRLTDIGIANGYACFSFGIEPADVANWETVFESRHARNYGELFHLGFLPLLRDIRVIPKNGNVTGTFRLLPQGLVLPQGCELKMNQKTIDALQSFLNHIYQFSPQSSSSKGGSRKMRRRYSRRRRHRNRRGSRRLSRSRRR
jgi:8-oxo-dGTP pyrophosphatase MutT (NUDIX family)